MKVSIIITSFNYGNYIERCLRSCLSQNFPKNKYEIIIVDDASSDDTLTLLEKYRTLDNFRLIVNKKNLGVAESSNIGIRNAFGQYVVRIDADDYVSDDFVKSLVSYMEANHDVFCVACDYFIVTEMGDKILRCYAERQPISCGIMYQKDLLIKLGLYNPDFRHREEQELRKRLGQFYKIDYLRIPLYRYRMHTKNKTKQLHFMRAFKKKMDMSPPVLDNKFPQENILQHKDREIIAIIPARGGSRRLKKKNIYKIFGKPMIFWAIKACKQSEYINKIYVTTEDSQIKKIANKYGAIIIDRPLNLAEDSVYKMAVVRHAVEIIDKKYQKPDIVVVLQPNSPQVKHFDIDRAIEKLVFNNLKEIISLRRDLIQDGAFRILKYPHVYEKDLSTHVGGYITDYIDIHTIDDVKLIEERNISI